MPKDQVSIDHLEFLQKKFERIARLLEQALNRHREGDQAEYCLLQHQAGWVSLAQQEARQSSAKCIYLMHTGRVDRNGEEPEPRPEPWDLEESPTEVRLGEDQWESGS